MDVVVLVLVFALLAAVIAVVGAPLRAARRVEAGEPARGEGELRSDPSSGEEAERDALEAAREAKYREIRDAELDYRTGKLSREDYEAIDATLRAEALEILDRLQDAGG